MTRYLYRALRLEEIQAGNILIPKDQDAFLGEPQLDTEDCILPFVLGPTKKYAIRQHQDGSLTSGISTTPHLDRANFYAARHRTIVKINRERLRDFGISEYVVSEYVSTSGMACPPDNEVILVSDENHFPTEIITEVIRLE